MSLTLGITIAVSLAWVGSGDSTTPHASLAERKDTEESSSNDNPQVLEANRHFIERARAIEASFKSAFLFHK